MAKTITEKERNEKVDIKTSVLNNVNNWECAVAQSSKRMVWKKVFKSVEDLADFAEARVRTGNGTSSWAGNEGGGWEGMTWTEALWSARHGWPDGREKFVKGITDLGNVHHAPLRRWDHDVGGAFPDVQRAIAGDPMSMRVPVKRPLPAIRMLQYHNGFSASVKAEVAMTWGIAIASLIEESEAMGSRIELWTGDFSEGNKHAGHDHLWTTTTLIKAADQATDKDKMAFSIGSPAFLRRLLFASTESLPFFPAVTFGYGRPCVQYGHGAQANAEEWRLLMEPGCEYLPSANFSNAGTNVEKAIEQLRPWFDDRFDKPKPSIK